MTAGIILGPLVLTTDAKITAQQPARRELTVQLTVVNNVATWLPKIRALFFNGDMVEEADSVRRKVYQDLSPFKTNTIYVELLDIYSGWAIIGAPVEVEIASQDIYRFGFTLHCIDDYELQLYTVTHELTDYITAATGLTTETDRTCNRSTCLKYTPTSSGVTVASIGASHLPSEDYQVCVAMKSAALTAEAQLLVNGTTGYGWTGNTIVDTWQLVTLGTPTLGLADTLAVQCRDLSATDLIRLDTLHLYAETYEGQKRLMLGIGSVG